MSANFYDFPIYREKNFDASALLAWTNDAKKIRTSNRFECASVQTESARQAAGRAIDFAGATLPERDSVGRRIAAEAASGKARYGTSYRGGGNGIIDCPEQVGGWPYLRPASAPRDSDGDGMPDAWEKRHELNPVDPADGNGDLDGDGYTNLEEFLNDE